MHRIVYLLPLAALALAFVGSGCAVSRRIPVILNTDIGDDIDDT